MTTQGRFYDPAAEERAARLLPPRGLGHAASGRSVLHPLGLPGHRRRLARPFPHSSGALLHGHTHLPPTRRAAHRRPDPLPRQRTARHHQSFGAKPVGGERPRSLRQTEPRAHPPGRSLPQPFGGASPTPLPHGLVPDRTPRLPEPFH